MKITFLIYLILCVAISIMMAGLGYHYYTWQYWVALACVIGAFQCGRFDERYGK